MHNDNHNGINYCNTKGKIDSNNTDNDNHNNNNNNNNRNGNVYKLVGLLGLGSIQWVKLVNMKYCVKVKWDILYPQEHLEYKASPIIENKTPIINWKIMKTIYSKATSEFL